MTECLQSKNPFISTVCPCTDPCQQIKSKQIKSNQVKSNQKSNQNKLNQLSQFKQNINHGMSLCGFPQTIPVKNNGLK